MPPEMKSASRMIGKGETIIGQKLSEMKYLQQSVRQSAIAKEQTVSYLRQELANLQPPLFKDASIDEELDAPASDDHTDNS